MTCLKEEMIKNKTKLSLSLKLRQHALLSSPQIRQFNKKSLNQGLSSSSNTLTSQPSMVWVTSCQMDLMAFCSMIQPRQSLILISFTLITFRGHQPKAVIMKMRLKVTTSLTTLSLSIRKSFYFNTSRAILMEIRNSNLLNSALALKTLQLDQVQVLARQVKHSLRNGNEQRRQFYLE